MEDETNDIMLKIVILGDSGVGKSNILSRYINDEFDEYKRNTIGVDFISQEQIINDKKVKIQFWDTAGQEKYKAIASAYYKNAHGVIFVYDITSV